MTVNPNGNSSYGLIDRRPALWQRWMALRNGALALANEIVAPELAMHLPVIGADPAPEPRRAGGRQALISWISGVHASFPGGRLEVRVGPIISGELMAGHWAFIGAVSFTGTDIIRTESGRIVEFWVNHDVLGQALPLRQAGPFGPVAV